MPGKTDPFTDKAHIDLLHLTRRACGHGWDDCRLQTAERRLLGFMRENDFPSHLIPQAWSEFVRGGGVESLNAIAEHNRHDVLSLAALLAMIARIYAEPGHEAAHALKIAQSHAVRGNAPHAIDHLANASVPAGRSGASIPGEAAPAAGPGRTGARHLAADSGRTTVLQGSRLWPNTTNMSRDELEAALELAEELLRLEPASEFHAKRRDRLRQRLARPKA